MTPLRSALNWRNATTHAAAHTCSACARAKVGRLRRRLSTPGVRISVAVLRGVRERSLAVAGVSPDRARAVFGSQVNEVEFLGALGRAASPRAARRAIRDGASLADPEEDAVLDLQPLWTARSIAHFVDALPNEWEIVQLAIVARQREWDELRTSWRRAATHLGSSQLLRRDFYWSSAAYLLHERGAQRLLARFRAADANASSAADNVAAARWRLGTDHVPCVKADLCVLYPSLRRRRRLSCLLFHVRGAWRLVPNRRPRRWRSARRPCASGMPRLTCVRPHSAKRRAAGGSVGTAVQQHRLRCTDTRSRKPPPSPPLCPGSAAVGLRYCRRRQARPSTSPRWRRMTTEWSGHTCSGGRAARPTW